MTMIPPFRGLDFKADDDDELIGRSQKGSRVFFFRLQKRRALLSIDDLLRFGERSVGGGGGSLTRRKKDRFARRCDDAFCWNAPNNKLSFLFFFCLVGFLLVRKERKKEKALGFGRPLWRIISLTDDASNEKGSAKLQRSIDAKVHN